MRSFLRSYAFVASWLLAPACCSLSPAIPQKKPRHNLQQNVKKPAPRPQEKKAAPPAKPAPQQPAPAENKKMTILLYVASDAQTESYLKFNCAQLEREGVPNDLTLLLFACNRHANGSKTATQIRLQGSKASVLKKQQINDSEAATLARALTWASEFKAERYGLIIWDHIIARNQKTFLNTYYRGQPRILVNSINRTALSDIELEEAIKTFTETQIKKPLDFIGFDTCMTGRLEIVAAVQPFTECIIGSNQLTSLGGWPYHLLLRAFKEGKKTGPSLARAVAVKYKEYYDPLAQEYTMSVFDTKKLGDLTSNASQIADNLTQFLAKQKGRTVTNAIYYSIINTTRAHQHLAYLDLGMWYNSLFEQAHTCACVDHEDTHQLATRLRNLLTHGLNLISEAVFHIKGTRVTPVHGLLVYLPNTLEAETGLYLQSLWAERFNWKNLLTSYLRS